MSVLVTGGAGYIGSHVVKDLVENDFDVITVDNLQKGHKKAVLGGKLIVGDIKDTEFLQEVFSYNKIEAVVHLAADSLVGESMEDPGKYYHNNLDNGIKLLDVMLENGVKNIVFSSTAAVYGEPEEVPIKEDHPIDPGNPYGESKYFFEKVMERYDQLFDLNYISLRYFNAAGADPSGQIGEDHDPETHLIPLVLDTALGKRDKLYIFGTDYETRDGTCVRDYIHVNDLASAHTLALQALMQGKESSIFNLGNGEGYTVKEVIETARQVTGEIIPAENSERRAGDPAVLIASSKKIQKELNWQAEYPDLETIIKTAWNWHKKGGFKQ
ncbi:MAG TPA: UDP-glucose 4-epimerase GalE [Halanaerobiales bacterium]|nr:UDP-glucose 4-epimerase GalE [Halanaerobiales bacterium]